jgi:predicted flap endonuclease-1-like 5' DNA nuclease
MLFTTFSQLIVLVILFFGGLLLGLGLHPGGRKWRQRFKDESDNYAQFRRDADLRLRDANRRVGELERENASLRDSATERASLIDRHASHSAPLSAPALSDPTPAVQHPVREPQPERTHKVAASAAVSAFPAQTLAGDTHHTGPEPDHAAKCWFGNRETADLERIRGIDHALKTSLFALGVTRFQDITEMSAVDEMALEQRLSLPVGYITREQWRDQAELLQAGRETEHAERFPAR